MAIKQLGAAESGASDAATKGYVDTQFAAADGSGLTNSGNVLSVGAGTGITVNADDVAITANYRSIAIPFFIGGAVTTGVKLAEFIFPVAATLVDMRARLNAGTGTTTIRPSKNAGSSDGSTYNVTTTSGNQSQSVSFAAGDRLTVNVTAVGTTPSDLSVTFWANIT